MISLTPPIKLGQAPSWDVSVSLDVPATPGPVQIDNATGPVPKRSVLLKPDMELEGHEPSEIGGSLAAAAIGAMRAQRCCRRRRQRRGPARMACPTTQSYRHPPTGHLAAVAARTSATPQNLPTAHTYPDHPAPHAAPREANCDAASPRRTCCAQTPSLASASAASLVAAFGAAWGGCLGDALRNRCQRLPPPRVPP